MKYMLDTNICIYIIRQKPEKVLRRFKSHSIGDIGISSVTLAELRFGVEKSQQIQIIVRPLRSLSSLSKSRTLTKKRRYVRTVRAALEKAGTAVGSMDMLIGAHALSLDLTLVTNNVREFKQIKNLNVVDWSV